MNDIDPYREIPIFDLWNEFLQQGDGDIIDIAKRLLPSADLVFVARTDEVNLHILNTRGTPNPVLIEGQSLDIQDSYCQYIYRNNLSSLRIDDAAVDPKVRDLAVTESADIGSYIGVPVFDQHHQVFGTFCAIAKSKEAFSDGDVDVLRKFGNVVTSLLKAQTLAIFDGLTGCLNRMYMNLLRNHWAKRAHPEDPIYVITFDMDRFRTINDLHGHEVGDLVLQKFSGWLCDAWSKAFVFRMGGDEFLVVGEYMLTDTETGSFNSLLDGSVQFIDETKLRVSAGIAYGTKAEFERVIRESNFSMYLHKARRSPPTQRKGYGDAND